MGGVLIGTAFAFTPAPARSYLLISFAVVVLGGVGTHLRHAGGGPRHGRCCRAWAPCCSVTAIATLVGLVLFLLVLALRPQGIARAGRT
jgi:branched-chain amino acid transport system permease protein